jgi:hypothetical protein
MEIMFFALRSFSLQNKERKRKRERRREEGRE